MNFFVTEWDLTQVIKQSFLGMAHGVKPTTLISILIS